MRKSLNPHTSYLNKFNGNVVPVFCTSYLLNIVFPSVSRSVPYKLRAALRDFFVNYSDLFYRIGDNQFTEVMKVLFMKFKKIVFLPLYYKPDYTYSFLDLIDKIHDSLEVIYKFLDFDFDIDLIKSLDYKRKVFICKLFDNAPLVDISAKEHLIRKKFNRRLATEIL